eukprot:TRINITY_DN65706_c0_g1_i1.p1 TRINITY_DN65706_c0_g1~~TRINITY_DN65706_c0_g1_i1.p1  ORF type:complete len:231 (+),score=66.50 TRINITY_DN65706_c0_g1_i1:88-780(+)
MPSPAALRTGLCPSPPAASPGESRALVEVGGNSALSCVPELVQESLETVTRSAVGGTRVFESAVVDLIHQVRDMARRIAVLEREKEALAETAAAQADEIAVLRDRAAAAEGRLAQVDELRDRVSEHHTVLHTTRWASVPLEDADPFDTQCVYRIKCGDLDGASDTGWIHATRVMPEQLLFEPASSAASFFGQVTADRKQRWAYIQRIGDLSNPCSYPVAGTVAALERAWL